MHKTLAIVVTWNKRDMLDRMLQSLLASGPRDYDLVIVDNVSSDGTIEMLAEKYPWAHVIVNPENLGGTGGFNRGMRHGLNHPNGYEYLWLLDNDVIVHPGALEGLRQPMRDDPKVGIVGGVILLLDDPRHAQEVGGRMSWRAGVPVKIDEGEFATMPRPQLHEADYVASCSLLARVSAVREVGIWDPAYFVTWDDIEWGLRFNRSGWKVVATTESQVEHESYRDRRPLAPLVGCYFSSRNAYYLYRRHAPRSWQPRLLLRSFRQALLCIDTFNADGSHYEAKLLRRAMEDFMDGKMGPASADLIKRPAVDEPRDTLPAGVKPPKRLGLIVWDNAVLARRMHDKLQQDFPGAQIDSIVLARCPEIDREQLPNTRYLNIFSFRARIGHFFSLPKQYDALVAPFFVYRHFFQSSVPLYLRYYPDLSWIARQQGMVRTLAHSFGRAGMAIKAINLTIRTLVRNPWPVDYHDFSERMYETYESTDGRHWRGEGGFGGPAPNEERFSKMLKAAISLPFAALTVAGTIAALPFLNWWDRRKARRRK